MKVPISSFATIYPRSKHVYQGQHNQIFEMLQSPYLPYHESNDN